jgi:hypothetical protein
MPLNPAYVYIPSTPPRSRGELRRQGPSLFRVSLFLLFWMETSACWLVLSFVPATQDQPANRSPRFRPSRIIHPLLTPFPILSYFHLTPSPAHSISHSSLHSSFTSKRIRYFRSSQRFIASSRTYPHPSNKRISNHTIITSQCLEAKERVLAARPPVLRTVVARARRATARRLVCR